MANEEYLRLPHGMFDRESDWIRSERLILDNHYICGSKIGCELEKYSPLGYKSTFFRGAHTADNKVYELSSKTGKDLLLSCDSSPSVLRKYVSSNNIESKRISFVAPLFRYKNSHSRHFTQIGYSFVNTPLLNEDVDFDLVQLTKAMIDLFSSMNIPTYIQVNNYKALKNILIKYCDNKNLDQLLYDLQFGDLEKRIAIIDQNINDSTKKQELINLFNTKQQSINDLASSNNLSIPEEYYEFLKTYFALQDMTGVNVIFNPSDLHSIETLDDIALRFKTKDGITLGDGGNYSCYANRWDKRITNFYSVATGVEAIERNKGININEDLSKLAVYCIDASNEFVLSTLNGLYDRYDSVIFYGKTNNISKAIKNSQKNCTHFVALGKKEEMSNEIEIKDLCNWTTEKIKISSENRKKVYKCQ